MTETFSTTRRAVLTGTAAIAATPAFASVSALIQPGRAAARTAVARLWAQAEAIQAEMAPYARQIATAHARTGLPGWMHVAGKANELGNKRYDLVVRVLLSQATSQDDLAISSKATNDADMHLGPRSWAHAEFDRASREFHLSSIA